MVILPRFYLDAPVSFLVSWNKHGLSAGSVRQGRTEINVLISLVKGVSGAEIHCRLSLQYGSSTLPYRSEYEYFNMSRNG